MRRVGVCGVVFGLLLATSAAFGFDVGTYQWFTYGGHSYALTQRAYGSWNGAEAEAEAAAVGGHLVGVNDAAENTWLASTFHDTYSVGYAGNPWASYAWIGLHGIQSPPLSWTNGDSVTYVAPIYNGGWFSSAEGGTDFAYMHTAAHPLSGEWANKGDNVPGIIEVPYVLNKGSNGHYYQVVNYADWNRQPVSYNPATQYYQGGITWTEARDDAAARGGHLVSITSAQENSDVFALVNPAVRPDLWFNEHGTGTPLGPWIGGFEQPAGNWQWPSGEPWGYTNWAGGEPSNGYLGPMPPGGGHDRSEDATMFFSNMNIWNDYPSWAVTNGYVVEFVPEPSTFVLLGVGAVGLLACGWRRRWR